MADWQNLGLLLVQAALYFAVMAALFRVRHRFGIGLVFCALGAMHFLETYLAAILYLQLPGGIVISPGSVVLFSGKLAILLLVYIREDAAAVRQPIYGLLIGNFLMVALVFTMRFHDVEAVADRAPDFRFMDEMGGLMIWGTILLFIDSILIILIYERSAAWFGERQAPRIIATSALVLTFDQLGFFTALWLLVGVPISVLFSGWIAKMGAAVVYGLLAAAYLRYVETASADRARPRLSDVFDTLTYRQRNDARDAEASAWRQTGRLVERGRVDVEGRRMSAEAAAAGRPLSLALVEVDRFAELRGRSGDATAGDILRQVGDSLRHGVRGSDRVFGLGDERFAIICDGLDHRSALLAAERVRRRIAASSAGGGRATVSAGVATSPDDGGDFDALLGAAGRRLAEARSAGCDRVVGRSDDGPNNVTPFPRRESA